MSDVLFENYEQFITEHADDVSSPAGVARMLNDEGMSRAYFESLTDGISDDKSRAGVMAILNRQREMILQEAANVPNSSFASGWTVLSFPILVDIYSEPIIIELANVYPIDKPMISIPRVRIKAQTRSYDGSTIEESYIPDNSKLIRAGLVTSNVTPGTNTDIFVATGLDPEKMKMNRRYTLMTKVVITETDAGSAVHAHSVDVNFRPDNRSQWVEEFTFNDSGATEVTVSIQGHVNYEKGIVSFQAIFDGGTAGSTFVADYAEISMRFVPVATMNGRTKVIIETELTDVTVDPNEDFLIDLTEEDMQDYNSIFRIDLLRTISEAIKRQILLNKDFDLAYFLGAAETDINNFGAKLVVDLDQYTAQAGAGDYTPDGVHQVLKAVVPRISTLMSIIRKNYNMYPSYCVTGLKTASLLRSLQDYVTNIPGTRGSMGMTGATSQFMNLKVLESTVIDENKIYLSTKAPNNALEKTSIVDLVYQPLYIVKEITDGNTRHFVRSRTMVDIVRSDGLGLLQVDNIDNYVG